ncbi:calcineurin-like phosphoesterase [Usnea florida]
MKRENLPLWLPLPLLCFVLAVFAMLAMFFSLLVLSSVVVTKADLNLAEDNSFKISVFSDLHYGENESTFGIAADMNSAALMRQVLSQEQPDFVILNGDLITGENTFAFNSTGYVDEIVAPLVQGDYSWASTYGNHDSKYNLSREALYAEEKKYAGAYTQHGPAGTDGVTNYVLPIFPANTTGNSQTPVALLWFFDSRGGSEYQSLPANVDNIDNYVSNGTVSWYRSTQADLQNQHGILPSLAFVHIPTLAFLNLQSETSPTVSGPNYPGLNADVPLAQQGYSNTGSEAIPFMQALLDTPGLHSIYSGHDHGDSWCGRWPEGTLPGYGVGGGSSQDRPFLCFCKHSGYGGYGVWNRGVRQVQMSFDESGVMSVDTWVRMQAGTVVTAVSLNETYGEDVYPTADGQ